MRVLVTGGTGFLGSHLAEVRAARGDRVWATFFEQPENDLTGTEGIRVVPCDVTVPGDLKTVLRASQPEVIFHFAAQTYIDRSWDNPEETFRTNVVGTLNVLNAVRSFARDASTIIAGSSAEYGLTTRSGAPLQETDPLDPVTPYGVSKAAQSQLGVVFAHAFGLRIVRVRIFNTIGPRKQRDFMADFCTQIAAIKSGDAPPCVKVGNIDACRDLTDVADSVRALDLLGDSGEPGQVYNVCSGHARRIGDVLDALLDLTSTRASIEVERARLRPSEEQVMVGQNRKLAERTGWRPTIAWDRTLLDTFAFWEQRRQSTPAAARQA